MPNAHSDQDQAESFADFFVDKIMKIKNEFDQYAPYEPRHKDLLTTFNMFYPGTDDMVKMLVRCMQTKSCELKLIAMAFLKEHIDDLSHYYN